MVLYIDLDLGRFVGAPGFGTAPRPIEHKRGDGGDVSIQFCRGTTLESLEAGSSIIYQAKLAGKYDADPLVECANFTDPAVAGGPHTGPLTFDVTALGTALAVDADEDNDVAALDVMYEVSWKLPGKGWASTDTLAGKINNDVIRSDQGVIPEIVWDVTSPPAQADLLFDDAAIPTLETGTITIDSWTLNLWDGVTGSAPASPYLTANGYPWIEWIRAIRDVINTSVTSEGGFTLTGSPTVHPTVKAGIVDDNTADIYLRLIAKTGGTGGNSLAYSFAATPSTYDASGTLAGGAASRAFESRDFVTTQPEAGLDTFEKANAIFNLVEQGVLRVAGADLEVEASGAGLILRSPDQTRWRVTVDNAGALSTTSI